MSQTIGDKLRLLREARGMTQDDLAEAANLNRVTIAKYESGRIEPKSKTLLKLANALEVSPDYLITAEHIEKEAEFLPPKSTEAKIISAGIDRMSPENRARALNMFRLMFSQYEEYFNEGTDDDDPKS